MQDYLFVAFFLGHDGGDAARELLRACNLLDVALSSRANRNAWLSDVHTGIYIRLPSDDSRLQCLLTQLRARLVVPITRIDREYSQHELDAAEWLMLRVATAGLLGGADFCQTYDSAIACSTCGAGAVPKPPLIVDLGRMGRKDLDHLVYEGHFIVTRRLATALEHMTGVSVEPARSPRFANSNFFWLRITNVLPKMHPSTSGYQTSALCPICQRAGHYSSVSEPESVLYETLRGAQDFNLTWECFGDWQQRRSDKQVQRVAGSQGVVVSQRVRQKLAELKVRRLVWVPVRTTRIRTIHSLTSTGV